MNITIKELTRILKGQLVLGDPKQKILRACVDSRTLQPSDAFFALKGQKSDGHDFCVSAERQGATCVVVSHLEWLKNSGSSLAAIVKVDDSLKALQKLGQSIRLTFKGRVVGITGSNGKTTTKQMVSSILKQTGQGLSTHGNFNSQIGLPLVLSELSPEHKWMVLELGASEPGNIHQLADIARPHIGVITNVGPAHLATFGSLSKVAQTKWELMESLPSDGVAILPWGEQSLENYIRSFSRKIIFFGEDTACPVRASSVEVGEKVQFQLHIVGKSVGVRLPVGGRFNVRNALAAAAACWTMGVPIETIAGGLEVFTPPSMRMELSTHSSGATIINDAYNANPASMMNSILSFMESFPDKKKVVVLGSMLELGDESEKLHFHVGTELGRCPLEKVLLFGEETKAVKEGAIASGAPSDRFIQVLNHCQIKDNLVPLLNQNTVVIFKGSRATGLEKVVDELMSQDRRVGSI